METPDRSSIKEANEHIRMLCMRVSEQEETIQEQADVLRKKDELYKQKIRELSNHVSRVEEQLGTKTQECSSFCDTLAALEMRLEKLTCVCREKETKISRLEERCTLLENVAHFTPMLENLVKLLRSDASLHLSSHLSGHVDKQYPPESTLTNGQSPSSSEMTSSSAQVTSHLQKGFNINSNFSGSEDGEDDVDDYRGPLDTRLDTGGNRPTLV